MCRGDHVDGFMKVSHFWDPKKELFLAAEALKYICTVCRVCLMSDYNYLMDKEKR